MAKVGIIEQYKGPFDEDYELDLKENCKIGISIGEDDFMSWNPNKENGAQVGQDFVFLINDKEIHMGRTCMYEIDNQIEETNIKFPDGAPLSLIVDVVYCS